MRSRRFAFWAFGALLLTALASAVVAYGYYALRLGCPSQAELQRPLPTGEVTEAFTERDLGLAPARLPFTLPPGMRAYSHLSAGAALYVVVCEGNRCSDERVDDQLTDLTKREFPAGGGPPQRMRSGVSFLNVFVWATDSDRRSAQRLMQRVYPIADELDRNPSPGDRCYVQ